MINVGIVGANGQVGAELALHWADQHDAIRLTGLTRSEYGTTLLRLAGVSCETYDIRDGDSLRQRFGAFDLVADFSYPSGRPTEAIPQFRAQVQAIVGAMKPDSTYVSMSSVMALGMASSETRMRHRRIARTAYAAIKRSGERTVARAGRTSRVKCHSFRLGQVHGVLQSVTQQIRSDLEFADVAVRASGEDASIAVFIPTIARALIACATGRAEPGVYTVVEHPAWSVRDLYGLYERIDARGAAIRFDAPRTKPKSGGIVSWAKRRVAGVRGPLEAYVLTRSDLLYRLAKGWYRRQPFAEAPADACASEIVHTPLVGTVPGPFVPGSETDPNEIDHYFRAGETRLAGCLQVGPCPRS